LTKIKNDMKNIFVTMFAFTFLVVQAAAFQLHRSDRDVQGNLICTYENGESINMGKTDKPCPYSISR